MGRQVTVNDNSHVIPNNGENAPWGEDLSDLLYDLSEVANFVKSSDDIEQDSEVIDTTLSESTSTRVQFLSSSVKSFIFDYTMVRDTMKRPDEIVETNRLLVDIATSIAGDTVTIDAEVFTFDIDFTDAETLADAINLSAVNTLLSCSYDSELDECVMDALDSTIPYPTIALSGAGLSTTNYIKITFSDNIELEPGDVFELNHSVVTTGDKEVYFRRSSVVLEIEYEDFTPWVYTAGDLATKDITQQLVETGTIRGQKMTNNLKRWITGQQMIGDVLVGLEFNNSGFLKYFPETIDKQASDICNITFEGFAITE